MGEALQFPKYSKPAVKVVLWEGPGRPTEEELRGHLATEGYGVVLWRTEPATGYPPHAHIYPEAMWVIEGSLTIVLPAEARLIEMPRGMLHGIMAGADGAVSLLATK